MIDNRGALPLVELSEIPLRDLAKLAKEAFARMEAGIGESGNQKGSGSVLERAADNLAFLRDALSTNHPYRVFLQRKPKAGAIICTDRAPFMRGPGNMFAEEFVFVDCNGLQRQTVVPLIEGFPPVGFSPIDVWGSNDSAKKKLVRNFSNLSKRQLLHRLKSALPRL